MAGPVPVLIVDDQAPFRRAARAVVTATPGFEVVGEAESGEEAVEMAAALVPGLVLMDINLPGINGIEATYTITTPPPTPNRMPSAIHDRQRVRRSLRSRYPTAPTIRSAERSPDATGRRSVRGRMRPRLR